MLSLLSPRFRRVAAPARPTHAVGGPRWTTQRSRFALELVFDTLVRWGPGTTRTWAGRSRRRWSGARNCWASTCLPSASWPPRSSLRPRRRHQDLEPSAAGVAAPARGVRPAPGRLPSTADGSRLPMPSHLGVRGRDTARSATALRPSWRLTPCSHAVSGRCGPPGQARVARSATVPNTSASIESALTGGPERSWAAWCLAVSGSGERVL
jgi:hypothetical protein